MEDALQKHFDAETKEIGDRQIQAVVSTADVDRDGDIIVPDGIKLQHFRRSPTVLFNHNPDHPIARCTKIAVEDGKVVATVQFPPSGASKMADEIYALIKSGVLNSTSIGFMPRNWERIEEAGKGTIGRRFTEVELLEFSIVSVPSNRAANIIQRQFEQTEQGELAKAIAAALTKTQTPEDDTPAEDAADDAGAGDDTKAAADTGGASKDGGQLSKRHLRRARLQFMKLQAGELPGGAGDDGTHSDTHVEEVQ